MGAGFVRRFAPLVAAFLMAGCLGGDGGERRRERLARDLADDAAAFNEAYAQAMTGQLLLNILRARDRLPTQYLAMSSIQDSPTISTGQSITLGSLNLGDIGSPWGVGEVSVGRDTQRNPSYSLGPFAADDLRRVVFDPTDPSVFAEYWNAGWPKEALLLLMADRIVRIDHAAGSAQIEEFVNDAEDMRDDCAPAVEGKGCVYVRLVRALAQDLHRRPHNRAVDMSGVCGLAAAYDPPRPQPRRGEQNCDRAARVLVGEVEYVVFLRSLDDIIYYLGELLRSDGQAREAIEAPIRIGSAGIDGGGRGVPLFRVVAGEPRGRYAASVSYDGARYNAGPAVARACARAEEDGPCRDDAHSGDRSSQVLALLSQLLLRNQSDRSVPPAPTVLITQ